MGDLIVRPVLESDLDRIRVISESIWEGSDYLGEVASEWLSRGGFYGGELDGRIIGTFRVTPMPGKVLWLEALRVHPDLQGKGYGRVLADSAVELGDGLIREGRADCMEFSTYVFNHESLSIAKSQGFRVVNGFHLLVNEAPAGDCQAIQQVSDPKSVLDCDGHVVCGWKFPRHCPEGIRWATERSDRLVCGSAGLMLMRGQDSYSPMAGADESPNDFLGGVGSHAVSRGCEGAEIVLHRSMTNLIREAREAGWHMWDECDGANVLVLRRDPGGSVTQP